MGFIHRPSALNWYINYRYVFIFTGIGGGGGGGDSLLSKLGDIHAS